MVGYYLPDLGEGLIIADDIQAGIELIRFKYSVSNNAVLPIENREGNVLFKENGFIETKKSYKNVFRKRISLGIRIKYLVELVGILDERTHNYIMITRKLFLG